MRTLVATPARLLPVRMVDGPTRPVVMSVDPDPSAPQPDPGLGHSSREKLPIPPVKRRHKKGNEPDDEGKSHSSGAADDEEDDPLMAEIEELSARVQALKAKRISAKSVVQANRGAKYHRLSRRQAPPATEPRDPAAPTSAVTPRVSIAAPVTLPAPPVIHFNPWHDRTWHPGWLVGTVSVVAVGILAFFLGQSSVQPTVLPPKQAHPVIELRWTPDQIVLLDSLYATERAGNPGAAFRQATQLNAQLGGRQGLSLYAALLQARAGGVNNAEADLVRMENAASPVLLSAMVQDRVGFIYARRRDFLTAAGSFSAAAAANPFDPLNFYHWGECLRRSGQLVDAMSKFELALQRLPVDQPETDSLRDYIGLRLRLTQIELGNDSDLLPLLEAQTRQPVPNVYWLLTQVAYSLAHNDTPQAAAMLEKARAATTPRLFEMLANDYYLRQLASRRSELAALVPEMTAERRARLNASMAYFIDP